MKRILLLVSVLLAGLPFICAAKPNTWVEEVKVAQAALAAHDYPTAYKLYLQQAAGNPLAQFMLGMFHKNGWGRAVDPAGACRWFERAAQKRIPTAEHYWGDCLAEGIERKPDIPAALGWYGKAAGDGHFLSQCSAADYYIKGRGVAKDINRGIEMCKQVAQANSPPAMLKLAHYYQDGSDMPYNPAVARYWYEQAAQFGVAQAQYALGQMLAQGEGGEADEAAARYWLEAAASTGYAQAYLPTAELYANTPPQPDTGVLSPQDLAKIYLWTAAAKARADNDDQRKRIARIETLLDPVLPATWRPDLDKQVAEHLARYP